MKDTTTYGVAIALMVIAAWIGSLALLLSAPFHPALILPGAAWMTFLSTGLFITAHDAMHGTVAPGNRKLNDVIGAVAVALYALFSYRKLHAKHHEHHAHPAQAGDDPDYHDGENRSFWRWYLHFALGYVSIWQIVGMAIVFNVLSHVIGIAEPNLLAFWVIPALLSTLQLFYFGTYLPHRGVHDDDDPHRARSNDYPAWLSFLTCYHFGYHREHHESPGTPWWKLPSRRKQALSRLT